MSDAAALALIALGTNGSAGLPSLITAYASHPHFYPWVGAAVAVSGLPGRHAEMIAGITAGLDATNTAFQRWAITLTRFVPDWQRWRPRLLQLTGSADPKVGPAALWALATRQDVTTAFTLSLGPPGQMGQIRWQPVCA